MAARAKGGGGGGGEKDPQENIGSLGPTSQLRPLKPSAKGLLCVRGCVLRAMRPCGGGGREVLRVVVAVAWSVDAWAVDRFDARGETGEGSCDTGCDAGTLSRCRAECVECVLNVCRMRAECVVVVLVHV